MAVSLIVPCNIPAVSGRVRAQANRSEGGPKEAEPTGNVKLALFAVLKAYGTLVTTQN